MAKRDSRRSSHVVTINPENWVNTSLDVTVYETDNIGNTEFIVNDYRFLLVVTNLSHDADFAYEKAEVFRLNDLGNRSSDFPICVGIKMTLKDSPRLSDKTWEMYHDDICESSLSRSDDDPVLASAKVIANVL